MQTKNKDPVADGLGAFFRGLGRVLKNAFYGMRKLNKPLNIGGLLLFLLTAFLAYRWQEAIFALEHIGSRAFPLPLRYVLCGALLCSPVLYLAALGSAGMSKGKKFEAIFAEIQFMGKDKKYPFLVREIEDEKKTTYHFQSLIPLSTWEKEKEQLETVFNCTLYQIREGKNKRTVELVTIPGNQKLPTLLRWDDSLIDEKDGVLVVGESQLEVITFDLNADPHVLAAGQTGSGKSAMLRCLLWQMLRKGSLAFMIDFKGGVEFGLAYEKYGEVIMNRERALEVLELLVQENEARMALFRSQRVKNLKEYNQKTGADLCRICVFCDELAEMLDKSGASKEDKGLMEQLDGALSTIARLGRAQGINLFLGVQRPDAKVVTGQIKSNVPIRLCGRFADRAPSEIVLGNTDAMALPQDVKGRFLFQAGRDTIQFQAYLFMDEKDLKELENEPKNVLLKELHQRTTPAVPKKPQGRSTPEPAPAPKKTRSPLPGAAAPVDEPGGEPDLDFNFDDFEEDIDF